jgi:hypothetical protein
MTPCVHERSDDTLFPLPILGRVTTVLPDRVRTRSNDLRPPNDLPTCTVGRQAKTACALAVRSVAVSSREAAREVRLGAGMGCSRRLVDPTPVLGLPLGAQPADSVSAACSLG